ncbi:MAG: multiheme c-type cytochrome [Myxococcota bacterium]
MPTTLAAFFAVHAATAAGIAPAADPGGLSDTACIGCHADEALQWFQSPHRTAFSETPFLVANEIEPAPFCRRCHAPHADPKVAEITPNARLGVSCTDCHLRDEAVVTWNEEPRANRKPSPHAVQRRPRAESSATCAPCHEFAFPDAALRDEPLFMQRTMSEHAESRFADTTCVECHMGDTPGPSHEFIASRSAAMIAEGVRVDAKRSDATSVTITLRAGRIGHAFPTGDLFRRVEVGVQTVLEGGEGPSRVRYLARHFGSQVQSSGIVLRGELGDNRVPANGEPRVVTLSVPESQGRVLRWWVEYQRVGHHTSHDPRSAALDGTIRVAEGELQPTEPKSGSGTP